MDARGDDDFIELNGEEDETWRTETRAFTTAKFQARSVRDLGQPSVNQHKECMFTHRPFRSWCQFCLMGREVSSPLGRPVDQDDVDRTPHVSMDFRVPW